MIHQYFWMKYNYNVCTNPFLTELQLPSVCLSRHIQDCSAWWWILTRTCPSTQSPSWRCTGAKNATRCHRTSTPYQKLPIAACYKVLSPICHLWPWLTLTLWPTRMSSISWVGLECGAEPHQWSLIAKPHQGTLYEGVAVYPQPVAVIKGFKSEDKYRRWSFSRLRFLGVTSLDICCCDDTNHSSWMLNFLSPTCHIEFMKQRPRIPTTISKQLRVDWAMSLPQDVVLR